MRIIFAIALFAAVLAQPSAHAQTQRAAGDFDFFVLALSWSPTFCAGPGRNDRYGQCDANRSLGFVVHGLWPQYETGWPEFCDDASAPEWLDEDVLRSMLDIMPSRNLVIHQWRKHGRCSGLSQRRYFDLVREAAERITLPAELAPGAARRTVGTLDLESDFMEVNAELDADEIAVTCDRRALKEVRICLSKDLEPRACPEVDQRACTRRDIVIP